jgi:hypothetical protein
VRESASCEERSSEVLSHHARAAAPHSRLPACGDTQYSPLLQPPRATTAAANAHGTAMDLNVDAS